MKGPILALILIYALLANVAGQQSPAPATTTPAKQPSPESAPTPSPSPEPSPTPEPKDSDFEDVVRITTNLIQLDVVVTDKEGNQVTDLTDKDFEIQENGKPRTITNFSYVSTAPSATELKASDKPAPTTKRDRSAAPTVAPIKLKPEQVRRALALVVDDLRMSAEGIGMAKEALRKYVDEQVQPGDLVAILRTSAGIGALQQFTSDRQQLYAAIERIRARAGNQLGAFTAVNMLDRLETQVSESSMTNAGEIPESAGERRRREGANGNVKQLGTRESDRGRSDDLNEFRDNLFTVGTIGALNFVVRGLKELPGRKAVVLLSDGISIFNADSGGPDRNERVINVLRRLVDEANRASVVFYAVDTRGLQPGGLMAADSTSGGPAAPGGSGPAGAIGGLSSIQPDQVGQVVIGSRNAEIFEGQNGLNYLTQQTGGLNLFNSNDLNKGIRRALEDIRGYYLIGYRPDEATFDPAVARSHYNTWSVKIKNRPNLRVRTRKGFIGVAQEQARLKGRSEQLMSALLSPFASSGVKLQLTSFFMNDASVGSTMRSVILMDTKNLTFTPQPDGQLQTTLDIVAVTLGENGQIVDQVSKIETIRVKPDVLERFQREGMVYGLNVPTSKPGAYQLRIAVRDAASGRVGSASQYVEVPPVGKDRLTLSSVVISGNNPRAPRSTGTALLNAVLGRSSSTSTATPTTKTIAAGGEGMLGTEDPQAGPASRRFRHGMYLDYAAIIYNAKRGKSKIPQLNSQVRLFHAGEQVFEGQLLPVDLSAQADLSRPVVARRLLLGTILEPGDYVLHLTVSDATSKGEKATATRWIDFEILESR